MNRSLQLEVLRHLEAAPQLTQRELAVAVGASLGRTNFVVRALVEEGVLKAERFKNSQNKWAYSYLLTPRGLAVKARLARRFLREKLVEYDRLCDQIEELRREFEGSERASAAHAARPHQNGRELRMLAVGA